MKEELERFSTKYLFTRGIEVVRGHFSGDTFITDERYARAINKKEIHLTRKDALLRAEDLREKEIRKVGNKLQKIKMMEF